VGGAQPRRITETFFLFLSFFLSLRVEFLLKTNSGYPKEKGEIYLPWQPLGIPSAITPLRQLHQSPPSPIPGDRARGKRRGFSPGAAAHHRSRTRGVFPRCFPLISRELRVFWTIFPVFLKSDVSHSIFPKSDIVVR